MTQTTLMKQLGAGLFAAVILVGCNNAAMTNDTTDNAVPTTAQEEMTAEAGTEESMNNDTAMDHESMDMTGEVKTFTLEAGSFYYKPDEIRVKKGDKVKVIINSVDMMHDFNIDALNVKLPITKSGETNSVEFTADEVGEFEFYCSVGQHKANGQVGTLIVEE